MLIRRVIHQRHKACPHASASSRARCGQLTWAIRENILALACKEGTWETQSRQVFQVKILISFSVQPHPRCAARRRLGVPKRNIGVKHTRKSAHHTTSQTSAQLPTMDSGDPSAHSLQATTSVPAASSQPRAGVYSLGMRAVLQARRCRLPIHD